MSQSLHRILFTVALLGSTGCPAEAEPDPEPEAEALNVLPDAVLDGFDMTRIRDDVELLAADDMGGRVPGSLGHAAAGDWILEQLEQGDLVPLAGGFELLQPMEHDRTRWMLDEAGDVVPAPQQVTGRQFLAVLPGSDPNLADEYVVLMAHYDHNGVNQQGDVQNGAFDNAVAVASLLELARVLTEQDVAFPRSLLLLFTDLEEEGLIGAHAWVDSASVPLATVALAMSLDPLGRPMLPDFAPLAVLGSERCAGHRAIWADVAERLEVPIMQGNRSMLLGFGSDQDAFWQGPEPTGGVWIASPGMTWYHTQYDDPETIDYRSVLSHLPMIAEGAATFASSPDRCEDLGEQGPTIADMEEVVRFFALVEQSEHLTDDERSTLAGFRDPIREAIDLGEVTPAARGAYVQSMLFTIQELTVAHPGPVPPPFPE